MKLQYSGYMNAKIACRGKIWLNFDVFWRMTGRLEGSFSVNGPKLFNSLPSHLRNMTGVSPQDFKRELDKFLGTVPDEPLTTGYTARRRAESNSLLHMIPACKV